MSSNINTTLTPEQIEQGPLLLAEVERIEALITYIEGLERPLGKSRLFKNGKPFCAVGHGIHLAKLESAWYVDLYGSFNAYYGIPTTLVWRTNDTTRARDRNRAVVKVLRQAVVDSAASLLAPA
jgi:hypothetical protein